MHHVSQDKRTSRSAELIYQGLLQCLSQKPFGQITVTDIQKATGVARTTFYRSFDNLADVLYWRCEECFREALHTGESSAQLNEAALIRSYFAYWMAHGDILKLLIDIDRQDIIYTCHMKQAKALEAACGALPRLDSASKRYFMAIRTGVTISMLQAWLDGGQQETPEELVDILIRQVAALSSQFHP